MEKFLHILIGFAIIYSGYFFLRSKINYTSESKQLERRNTLKTQGMSSCYFFMIPKKLLLLNILSGGFFFFYWSCKQWQAVISGYKNATGTKLKYGAFLRAMAGIFSFYQLTAIVNRTCEYMHKKTGLSHLFWGTVTWLCPVLFLVFMIPLWVRVPAAVLFLSAPYFLQKHINTLPKEVPPSHLKFQEIICLPIGWSVWAGIIILLKVI